VSGSDSYVGVEFVMIQKFLSGSYDYGKVCSDKSPYEWINLDVANVNCSRVQTVQGQKWVTVSISINENMHDPS